MRTKVAAILAAVILLSIASAGRAFAWEKKYTDGNLITKVQTWTKGDHYFLRIWTVANINGVDVNVSLRNSGGKTLSKWREKRMDARFNDDEKPEPPEPYTVKQPLSKLAKGQKYTFVVNAFAAANDESGESDRCVRRITFTKK